MKLSFFLMSAVLVGPIACRNRDGSSSEISGVQESPKPSYSSHKPQSFKGSRWAKHLKCEPLTESFKLGAPEEVTLPENYEFLEGPLWHSKSNALLVSAWNFADPSEGKGPKTVILKYADEKWKTFSEKGLIRSNGLAVGNDGGVIAAVHDEQAVIKVSDTLKRVTIAGEFEGKTFNSPNDLAVRSDGTIFFTDPDYQKDGREGQGTVTGVYGISKSGEVFLVDDKRKQPNGIALSPDEHTLYVGSADGILFKYKIESDSSTGEGEEFANPGKNIDGLTVDCLGNVYASIHEEKKFIVYSPKGKELQTVNVEYNITNLAFGGTDQKTLFATTAGHLFQMKSQVSGSAY